jgi:hypothetical protein
MPHIPTKLNNVIFWGSAGSSAHTQAETLLEKKKYDSLACTEG